MKIYKNILLLLVFNVISLDLVSQEDFLKTPKELSQSCTIEFINDINNGTVRLEDLHYVDNDREDMNNRYWVVYSDRSNNFLYNFPNGSTLNTRLEYMQPLRVQEVEGKWLKVYTTDYKELGWVKSDYIMLNSYCLLTTYKKKKKSDDVVIKIPMKKIIITSIPELVSGGMTPEEAEAKRNFYSDPSTNMKNMIQYARDFEIFYVYKESGGSFLLANNDVLTESYDRNISLIKGWIPKGNTTAWDNRLMLEEARTEQAIQAYDTVTLFGFQHLKELKSHIQKGFSKKNTAFVEFQVGAIRYDKMRMPVLKTGHDDGQPFDDVHEIKKVVSIVRHTEGDIIKDSMLIDIERKLNRLQQNTNIIFVIDATSTMDPYFSSIAASIEEIMKENNKKNGNPIKFAVIIYRDYLDKVNNNDYKVLPLTADQSEVTSYLNNVDCSSRNRKLLPEAQFNGIIKGFDELNLDPEESNIMVLIGDCGNHPNPDSSNNYDVEDVADILDKYNLNVISFQVNTDIHHETYAQFNKDIKKFIQIKANKITSNTDTDLSAVWKRVEGKRHSFELSMVESSEDFVNTFGRVIYAVDGKMHTDVLKNHITERLVEYMDVTDKNLIILRKWWNPKVDKVPEGLLLFIMKSLELTREGAQEFLQRNEVTQSAYVSLKYNGSHINALEHVVFMTDKDYRSLRKELNRFTSDDQMSYLVRAKQFEERLISICKNMLGGSASNSDISPSDNSNGNGSPINSKDQNDVIDNLVINDVWLILFGVEYDAFTEIKNTKLNRIASFNKKKILKDVMDDFEIKCKLFCSKSYFSHDENESRVMTIYNNNFYWIPIEDIPGTTKIDS